ncbi:MAG: endonuclease III domain-containing protein [Candidatus Omnitrophica bacterium]|nr:endonuclease III domain-containing protein [Candidatus Omnitrophota bacterium]
MSEATKTALMAVYQRLFKAFGPQKWWPAQTRFEVMVGAILTQNTNWGNVEKALNNLKQKRLLSPQALKKVSPKKLALLIRPAGYFNIKTKRLKNFISFMFREYDGDLKKMAREDMAVLRHKLLEVSGIGPETADSILLYALDKPVFVVDAYTKRILYRHNMAQQDADYHAVQDMFMRSLDHDVSLFNEYHALIVRLGKDFCKSNPLCPQCPLNSFHYSLVHKCSRCHRALPSKRDRISAKAGYLCCECDAK